MTPFGPGPVEPPPLPPPPPALEELTIACPANRTVIGTSALTRVTWAAPTTEHGVDPVTVTCVPAAGAGFAPGKSRVTCTAQDGAERSASCGFTVTVKVPRTKKTKYLAFGDSITEGYLREKPETYIVPSLTYPAQVKTMLEGKYPAQKFTVVNAGVGGETAEQGRARLPGVLDREKPEVLLLLEGYNHIRRTAPSSIQEQLRLMINEAKARGVAVILATLTPVTPDKDDESPGTSTAVEVVSEKIRALSGQAGVPLVDLYSRMYGRWSLFGSDGVHPNPDGYEDIAEAFFDEIVKRFGGPPALLPSDLTLFAEPDEDVWVDSSEVR